MPSASNQSFAIIHLTTVHSRTDTRVRFKEAETLAQRYRDRVALYVMDGKGNEFDLKSSLQIVDIGKRPKGRLIRMILGNWRAIRVMCAAAPKIVHFHDPELILTGLVLSLLGIKVIYDIHEDVPNQVLTKAYIRPAALRRPISIMMRWIESAVTLRFAAVVVAVDSIGERFASEKTVVARNFPRGDLMTSESEVASSCERFVISYAGSLTRVRGIPDLVSAMDYLPKQVELQLFGTWHPASLEDSCQSMQGWSKCRFMGRVPHNEVVEKMKKAHLGVQLTHDIPNHTGGLATKVFEYLFQGVPVLMSDTAEKRSIYGNLVHYAESANPVAIADEIRGIIANYDLIKAQTLGTVPWVREAYSWEAEAKHILALYERLLVSDRQR